MTDIAFKTVLGALAVLGLIGIQPAYAYLDPGTGSIILQAVIGAVAGALIVVKLYWYRFTSFLRGNKVPGAGERHKDAR